MGWLLNIPKKDYQSAIDYLKHCVKQYKLKNPSIWDTLIYFLSENSTEQDDQLYLWLRDEIFINKRAYFFNEEFAFRLS